MYKDKEIMLQAENAAMYFMQNEDLDKDEYIYLKEALNNKYSNIL